MGAATPTVWPSASWNPPPIRLVGAKVVNLPATGIALPLCPTTEPLHVYVAAYPSGSVVAKAVRSRLSTPATDLPEEFVSATC